MGDSDSDNLLLTHSVIKIEQYEIQSNRLIGIRSSVRTAQQNQADRIVKFSEKYYAPADVGTGCILPVPDVDTGLADSKNIICQI